MYPRTKYEMSEADLAAILEACKPVPYMIVGGMEPATPQENANRAWAALGQKMGFDSTTVEPISGQGTRFFTAVPSETESQRAEREKNESEKRRLEDIADLERQYETIGSRLRELRA